jgi:hypothetical protein
LDRILWNTVSEGVSSVSPRKRYAFWIDSEQETALKEIRERVGILPSEQIRRAIDAWVKTYGTKKTERKRGVTRRKRP